MEKDIKPVEKGNAELIKEKCHPIMFTMLQYEQIANFYTEEPLYIRAKLNEEDKLNVYEQILRIRYKSLDRINSWCIYSLNREWSSKKTTDNRFIIRNVIWDRKHDLKIAKDNQDGDKKSWPTLYIKNIYINSDMADSVKKGIEQLDHFVRKGIVLKKRGAKEYPPWLYFEVMRWFDWGQVKATWSPYMMNNEIETLVIKINELLEQCIANVKEMIYQMDLDYLIPPEVFKKYTQGI